MPHDAHRLGSDRGRELCGGDAKSVLARAGNLNALRTCEFDERLVRNPRGRRQQHFIHPTWFHDCLQRHVDRVLGAGGHRDLLERCFDSVFLREFVRDGQTRTLVARRGRVLGHAFLESMNCDTLDVVWSIKVRLAHGKGDDIVTSRARRGGLRSHGERGGFRHRCDASRNEHARDRSGSRSACRTHQRLFATLVDPMHYDAHQPVIDELEARILTLRDSL